MIDYLLIIIIFAFIIIDTITVATIGNIIAVIMIDIDNITFGIIRVVLVEKDRF